MITNTRSASSDKKSPRWVRYVLVISIAFNLLFIGIAASAFMKFRSSGRPETSGRALASGVYFRALSQEDQAEILDTLRGTRDLRRTNRQRVRTEILVTIDLLRADVFDPDVLSDALRRQRAYASEYLGRGDRAFVEHINAMNTSQRRAYADRLETELMRRRKPDRR